VSLIRRVLAYILKINQQEKRHLINALISFGALTKNVILMSQLYFCVLLNNNNNNNKDLEKAN